MGGSPCRAPASMAAGGGSMLMYLFNQSMKHLIICECYKQPITHLSGVTSSTQSLACTPSVLIRVLRSWDMHSSKSLAARDSSMACRIAYLSARGPMKKRLMARSAAL